MLTNSIMKASCLPVLKPLEYSGKSSYLSLTPYSLNGAAKVIAKPYMHMQHLQSIDTTKSTDKAPHRRRSQTEF